MAKQRSAAVAARAESVHTDRKMAVGSAEKAGQKTAPLPLHGGCENAQSRPGPAQYRSSRQLTLRQRHLPHWRAGKSKRGNAGNGKAGRIARHQECGQAEEHTSNSSHI